MSIHVMAVATYYQLFRGADGFNLNTKEVINEKVLVPRKHIEKINRQSVQCGKHYVIDEEATEAAFKQGEANVKAIREAQADADELGKVMADTLKSVKAGKATKPKTDKTALLDKVEELTGKRPSHLTGEVKLNAMIEAAESNNN